MYDNQFLYQKTGFLLSQSRGTPGLSNDFFKVCLEKIGKSKRYLSSDYKNGRYDNTWQLVIPDTIYGIKNGETENDIL